jgi:D-alanyl-D-alanine carboxypeptidase (penicillin-binding protein 5/6)
VDGLKTGYTKSAGYCLSATAERNGRRIIVVIMGSFGPNGQIDLGRSRDLKTIELIERGFATLQASSPAPVAPASTANPISPVVSPASSGPVRSNLSAPTRPAPSADDSPISPVSPAASEKPAAKDEEPVVKFVPVAPPAKSKTR